MPTHAERRYLPYPPEALFDLVADVEKYPRFLPWCEACRVRRRAGNVVWADLVVGFKMVREQFTSKVTLHRPGRIDVEYERGPFRYLNNHWRFIPEDGGCVIDFYIDFEVRSRLLRRVLEPLFNEAVRRMVRSFEARAAEIYGRPEKAGASSAPDTGGAQK